MFVIKNESKAALGVRNTALFAHTPGVRAPLSSTQRASFSVRRDPSTYSPAAFTERWNDVPGRTMGARDHASRLAGAVCSDEAGVPQQGGIFRDQFRSHVGPSGFPRDVERLAKLVTDDLSRPRPRNFANGSGRC